MRLCVGRGPGLFVGIWRDILPIPTQGLEPWHQTSEPMAESGHPSSLSWPPGGAILYIPCWRS